MTIRAILGLVPLNLGILMVGSGVLWGIRGWRTWAELLRLAGVAYVLGVSSLFVVLTAELTVGIPLTPVSIVLTSVALVLAGVLVGARRRDGVPPAGELFAGQVSVLSALLVAVIVVYHEALFRVGRLSDFGWDDWASWVPKAKSLYLFHEVDPDLFASLPGGSYPPGLPVLNAVAFHAMGSADAVTLHLQMWFYAVGFAAAVAGLLWRRVRALILLPFLLLIVVMPDLRIRATGLYGDIPLGYLVALSALTMLLWIGDSRPWRIPATTILLAGAMLTKREGLLFAVCIVCAALASTVRDWRAAWPRIVLVGAAAFLLALPWRLWVIAQGLPGDGPEAGYFGALDHLDRALPSFELVIETIFDYKLWLLVPTLALLSAGLAFLTGSRREATFTIVLFATMTFGSAWTFWANPSVEIGTSEGLVNRVVGTPVLALGVVTPVLLQLAWGGQPVAAPSAERRPSRVQLALGMAIVAVAAALYPAAILARGAPTFPRADDCVMAPVAGAPVRVVFGYANTFQDGVALRDRALSVGFVGTEAVQDGCGRVRVFLDDVPSAAIGTEVIREARTVGLTPSLEHDSDD